jgi:hypothetical protein
MTIWFLNGNYKELTEASVIIDDRTHTNGFLRQSEICELQFSSPSLPKVKQKG